MTAEEQPEGEGRVHLQRERMGEPVHVPGGGKIYSALENYTDRRTSFSGDRKNREEGNQDGVKHRLLDNTWVMPKQD